MKKEIEVNVKNGNYSAVIQKKKVLEYSIK
jgi:hypothetical protein